MITQHLLVHSLRNFLYILLIYLEKVRNLPSIVYIFFYSGKNFRGILFTRNYLLKKIGKRQTRLNRAY